MPWFFWLVVVLIGIEPLFAIARIGKERPPTAPSDAIAAVIINGLVIAGFFHYWGK